VFFGRWVSSVRVVAAVMAGTAEMPGRTLALYDALGAVAWAATFATTAALLGPGAVAAIYGAGVVAAGGAAAVASVRSWRRRRWGSTASSA
jgi:membrane protein DedA with SNARE-associated domain